MSSAWKRTITKSMGNIAYNNVERVYSTLYFVQSSDSKLRFPFRLHSIIYVFSLGKIMD